MNCRENIYKLGNKKQNELWCTIKNIKAQNKEENLTEVLTSEAGTSSAWAESTDAAPEIATGVVGKECVFLAETEEKTLVSENCLVDVEALSCCRPPSEEDGVPGMRRMVRSLLTASGMGGGGGGGGGFLVLRLRFCGARFLMTTDDLVHLVELGRGGKPADAGRAAEAGKAFSKKDLAGICREERLGGRLLE